MYNKREDSFLFQVRVKHDLHEAVMALVKETGIPAAAVMRRALENWAATGGVLPARVVRSEVGETGELRPEN